MARFGIRYRSGYTLDKGMFNAEGRKRLSDCQLGLLWFESFFKTKKGRDSLCPKVSLVTIRGETS